MIHISVEIFCFHFSFLIHILSVDSCSYWVTTNPYSCLETPMIPHQWNYILININPDTTSHPPPSSYPLPGHCRALQPIVSIVIIPILAPLLLQYNDYWTVCYLLSAPTFLLCSAFLWIPVILIFFSLLLLKSFLWLLLKAFTM